jgi:hypothetical protein
MLNGPRDARESRSAAFAAVMLRSFFLAHLVDALLRAMRSAQGVVGRVLGMLRRFQRLVGGRLGMLNVCRGRATAQQDGRAGHGKKCALAQKSDHATLLI